MANPLQKASSRRKVVYFATIIGLFALSILWRGGKFSIPLSDDVRAEYTNRLRKLGPEELKSVQDRLARNEKVEDYDQVPPPAPSAIYSGADWLASRTIESMAGPTALELRELDQSNDPEIAGTAARLSLVGARGIMVTILWRMAIEQQKRNEFQEFDLLVRTITQLQPHFITPWIYQSWNISYNVSVENDRLGDMYFYISRGIELLAQGERQNKNSPDMRYQIGFYYQNKFGVSDKVQTLRCLMQLSAIKPEDRKPSRFRKPNGEFDMTEFGKFCKENPQLVRRLRDKLNCRRPEEVVQFLEDNVKVPTRYEQDGRLLEATRQFPSLPPKEVPGEYEPNSETDDSFDAFHASKAWYEYSLKIIPPPSPEPVGFFMLKGENRFRYRMPKSPALIIFRQGAPRAQSYLAERLSKEGWFDDSTKWFPDERADSDDERWYPRTANDTSAAGVGLIAKDSALAQWGRASTRWTLHGELNGMQLDQAKIAQYERDGVGTPQEYNLIERSDEQLKAMGLTRRQVQARDALRAYEQNRSMTNFPYFAAQSVAEADKMTSDARKTLWDAEQAKLAGNYARSIELYAKGISQWRGVLVAHPNFHRPERSEATEELTYEFFLALVGLLEGSDRISQRVNKQMQAIRTVTLFDEEKLKLDLTRAIAEEEAGYLVSTYDDRVVRRITEGKILPPGVALTGMALADHPAVRTLIEKEFAWLGEYKSELRDDAWTTMDLKKQVRERMGLARPVTRAPAQAPTPAPAPGAAPR
ncbi:MAG: hypothetical protein ACRCZF_13565 [Gemmataceae bacterium]